MPTWTSSSSTPISAITERLTPRSPDTSTRPEHRRSDDDAGDDLAEDGRDADSFRQLGRQLGGGEDDEQVEEESREIDDRRGGEHAQAAGAGFKGDGARCGILRQHPTAAADGHDGVRAEHTADADEEGVAAAGAEVVQPCLTTQLARGRRRNRAVSKQHGEDSSLPRSQASPQRCCQSPRRT